MTFGDGYGKGNDSNYGDDHGNTGIDYFGNEYGADEDDVGNDKVQVPVK